MNLINVTIRPGRNLLEKTQKFFKERKDIIFSKKFWAAYFLLLPLTFLISHMCLCMLWVCIRTLSVPSLFALGSVFLCHLMLYGWVPLLFFVGLLLLKNSGISERGLIRVLLIGTSALSLYVGVSSLLLPYADFEGALTLFNEAKRKK